MKRMICTAVVCLTLCAAALFSIYAIDTGTGGAPVLTETLTGTVLAASDKQYVLQTADAGTADSSNACLPTRRKPSRCSSNPARSKMTTNAILRQSPAMASNPGSAKPSTHGPSKTPINIIPTRPGMRIFRKR